MLSLASWLIAIPPIVMLAIFSIEALLGTSRLKRISISGPMPSTCILIPAHDEARIIEATLERLKPIVSDALHLLVVADNCSDDTANVVRKAGFAVIERRDLERRGKGYALAFGRDSLRSAPPDCVIIFDADCATDADSIAALAIYCVRRQLVVQARYIFVTDRTASPKVQISNFAFWLKNVVRQRGSARLGGAAVLTGTGMAFPWATIENAPLATANIVEDLALGHYLTQAGKAPVFLEQATVESAAASESATLEQRSRWEHGFLATAKAHGFRTIRDGFIEQNRKLLLLGAHLLVPPLAFLLLFSTAALMLLGILALTIGNWHAFTVLAVSVGLSMGIVFVNWLIEGRAWLGFGALLRIPLYLVWKVPVYLRFAGGHRAGWTRTERQVDALGSDFRD